MHREMRRKDKELDGAETAKVFEEARHGVLATVGEDGLPYAVPLNFAYRDGAIYFHSAREGRKVDDLVARPRVTFCVIGMAKELAATFDTDYRSALAFGRAVELFDDDKIEAFKLLVAKYSPDYEREGLAYIGAKEGGARVFRIDVEEMTGKHQE